MLDCSIQMRRIVAIESLHDICSAPNGVGDTIVKSQVRNWGWFTGALSMCAPSVLGHAIWAPNLTLKQLQSGRERLNTRSRTLRAHQSAEVVHEMVAVTCYSLCHCISLALNQNVSMTVAANARIAKQDPRAGVSPRRKPDI